MKQIDLKVREYLDFVDEAVEAGAYETAALYAGNLKTFLEQVHKGTIRWCDEHEEWEQK